MTICPPQGCGGGGASAGVSSLNGLTGTLTNTTPNSTLDVGTSGSDITLDVNLASPNTWTALQKFGNNIDIGGIAFDIGKRATAIAGDLIGYDASNWTNLSLGPSMFIDVPASGNAYIDINLAHANTWTATQTFGNNISIGGAKFNTSSLSNGDVIHYNGTNWVNGAQLWNKLSGEPFVTVGLLAGAVAAGWDYGPDTSGTTTSGFDEAIAALPAVTLVGQAGNVQTATGGVIYVQNGVGTSFTSSVTIPSGSSLTIIGLTGSFDMNTYGSGFQSPGMTITTNTGMSTLYFANTISLPVFSAPNDGSGNSVTRLMMQGIEIRIQNPTALNTGAAVDLSGVTQGTLKDVLIDCTFQNSPGVSGQNIGIGLKMIRTGGGTTTFENLSISNFYQYGAQLSVPNLHIINIDVSDIDTSSGSHAAIYWEVCWFNSIHKAHIFNTYVGIQWIYGLNSADVAPYIGEISFENTELPIVAPSSISFPMIINHATFLYKALSTTSNYTGDVKDTSKTTLRSFDWFVNAAPTNSDKTFTTETPGFTPSGTVVHERVDCNIFITGGTVTDITVDGISTGQTSGRLTIFAGHNWSITYSVVPTVTRIKR